MPVKRFALKRPLLTGRMFLSLTPPFVMSVTTLAAQGASLSALSLTLFSTGGKWLKSNKTSLTTQSVESGFLYM